MIRRPVLNLNQLSVLFGFVQNVLNILHIHFPLYQRGCRGCNRMVVGCTITYAISVYHL
jgi:hypothetical protein